ncbi:hypothetical protein COLO4_27076 [Corchorus olitorius]|uniref:Uncharacterized protein n=1 Tax=Corchorus olitorius TaxID=93759 RepID=A0A1R3HT44_9ROSI|nr:hypothetical protein COLO4_27076 [Corchorus olitorius]
MASTAGSQDQRKRTLEALERRFAIAKAELLQQQKKNKKLTVDEDAKGTLSSNPPISNASTATPSKKDVEENSQAYSQLLENIDEKLLPANSKICMVLLF